MINNDTITVIGSGFFSFCSLLRVQYFHFVTAYIALTNQGF